MVILFLSRVTFLCETIVGALTQADMTAHSATSSDDADAAMRARAPDIIMVDMAHPDGRSLIERLRYIKPKLRVVLLALAERDEEFLAWADIGISGYLGPDNSARDIVSTLRRAHAGEVVCPARMTALLLSRYASGAQNRGFKAGLYVLTPREREIASLVADGLSNKLIARKLHVALPTVKNHIHSILDKWGVRSRGEAAARYRSKMHEADHPPMGARRLAHESLNGYAYR